MLIYIARLEEAEEIVAFLYEYLYWKCPVGHMIGINSSPEEIIGSETFYF